MSIEELHHKKAILEYKGGTIAVERDSVSLKDATGAATIGGNAQECGEQFRCRLSRHRCPPLGLARSAQPISSFALRWALSATELDLMPVEPGLSAPVEAFLQIFRSFCCVIEDSMELKGLKAHQFDNLLRESRIFKRYLTSAMVNIIYTLEKGKQVSGKLNDEGIINALVKKVARAADTRANSTTNKLV